VAYKIRTVMAVGSTFGDEAYAEAQQRGVAESDGVRPVLLEDLLARRASFTGPKRAILRAAGLGPDTRLLVATAVLAGDQSDEHALRDAALAVGRGRGTGGGGGVGGGPDRRGPRRPRGRGGGGGLFRSTCSPAAPRSPGRSGPYCGPPAWARTPGCWWPRRCWPGTSPMSTRSGTRPWPWGGSAAPAGGGLWSSAKTRSSWSPRCHEARKRLWPDCGALAPNCGSGRSRWPPG